MSKLAVILICSPKFRVVFRNNLFISQFKKKQIQAKKRPKHEQKPNISDLQKKMNLALKYFWLC